MATKHQEDNYDKKCHYTIRHNTCGHKTWTRPRVSHVDGCQHNPLGKKPCANMASKPKEVTTDFPCLRCRPANSNSGTQKDPFDILIQRAQTEQQTYPLNSRIVPMSAQNTEAEVQVEKENNNQSGKAVDATVGATDKESDNLVKPQGSQQKEDVISLEGQGNVLASKPTMTNSDATATPDKPQPPSILSSIWGIVLSSKSKSCKENNPKEEPTIDVDNRHDFHDEQLKCWEQVVDEEKKDHQLWKDNKNGWVFVVK